MITLNPQTGHKLKEMISQTGQSIQQLIESLLADYLEELECIKRADLAYAEYKKTREYIPFDRIKQDYGPTG